MVCNMEKILENNEKILYCRNQQVCKLDDQIHARKGCPFGKKGCSFSYFKKKAKKPYATDLQTYNLLKMIKGN